LKIREFLVRNNGEKYNIQVEEVLNNDTGLTSDLYFTNGERCPRIPIDSKRAKNYAAYALILKDLRFVKRAFNSALREISVGSKPESVGSELHYRELCDRTDMIEAFYLSAVISYGKCFAGSDGWKMKLEASDIFNNNKDKKIYHKELIHQRNQYVAHGGVSTYEAFQPIVLLDPTNRQSPPFFMIETKHTITFSKKDLILFSEVTDFVINSVSESFEKKGKLLFEKEITSKQPDEWWNSIDL
jgi:hypothetical protein